MTGPRVRPSILDDLRLSDGRLAWPVAASLGISEPAFRARLKHGWPLYRAVYLPVRRQRSSVEVDLARCKCRCGRPLLR